jgi:hypothetical protein
MRQTPADVLRQLTAENAELRAELGRVRGQLFRFITAAMHPYGRCACGAEGTCEWCQRLCSECLGAGCPKCRQTGWGDREQQDRVIRAESTEAHIDEAAKLLRALLRRVRSSSTEATIHLVLKELGRGGP